MEKDKAFYFNAEGGRAEVRVLVFNNAINIYESNYNFIKAFPLKGATLEKRGESILIFPAAPHGEYLQTSADSDVSVGLMKEISNANRGIVKNMARNRILWFGMIVVGFVIVLYFLIMSLVPQIGAAVISREVEIRMGNQIKEVMLVQEKALGGEVDAAGTVKLQAFADAIKLSDVYPIQVTLVNSSTVNAYALPGGQIVVYSGMLKNIVEPGELVALLAHEAAHVNQRHSLRAMLRNAADALVLSVLFSDVSAITAVIIGNTQNLRGLSYSRSAEREADEHGMKTMLENNINVTGMKKLMQILQKQGDVPEDVSFLSSHPLTKKRIEAADDFIKNHPQSDYVDNSLQTLFRPLKQ